MPKSLLLKLHILPAVPHVTNGWFCYRFIFTVGNILSSVAVKAFLPLAPSPTSYLRMPLEVMVVDG